MPRRITEDHNEFRDVVSGKIRKSLKNGIIIYFQEATKSHLLVVKSVELAKENRILKLENTVQKNKFIQKLYNFIYNFYI